VLFRSGAPQLEEGETPFVWETRVLDPPQYLRLFQTLTLRLGSNTTDATVRSFHLDRMRRRAHDSWIQDTPISTESSFRASRRASGKTCAFQIGSRFRLPRPGCCLGLASASQTSRYLLGWRSHTYWAPPSTSTKPLTTQDGRARRDGSPRRERLVVRTRARVLQDEPTSLHIIARCATTACDRKSHIRGGCHLAHSRPKCLCVQRQSLWRSTREGDVAVDSPRWSHCGLTLETCPGSKPETDSPTGQAQ
jgi:hypothetical protein